MMKRYRLPGWVVLVLVSLLVHTSLVQVQPVQAAPQRASRFGVVADIGTRLPAGASEARPIELLNALGAGWVKEEFRWDAIQPERNRWTWALMDKAVNAEKRQGFEILGLLDYSVGWAVGENRELSTTPPPLDLWAAFVEQTVLRYKDRVHAWEVWNEPNERVFWAGSKEQYAALLRVTYDTIKRVDPSATVLGPTISGIDEAWLRAMPWDKIDAVALHLYVPPATLNDQGYSLFGQGLPQMQQVFSQFPRKPIWITEFGYSSQRGAQEWFVHDEIAQARYLVQELTQLLAYTQLPIERVMPYVFNDHDGFELIHGWSAPKPAFHAYRTAIQRLDGATGQGRFNAGNGIFAFRFTQGGKQIDVLWSPKGGTATILSGSDGQLVDLLGGTRTVVRTGDVLQVPVNENPVYLLHDPVTVNLGNSSGFSGTGRLFQETNQAVRGPFLSYWDSRGGLAIYGFPISPELVEVLEDGKPYLVQYFERVRMEYHPENTAPNDVLLGQFGRALHPLYPPVPDCRCGQYFPETGHNIAGAFLTYWQQHGGLAQFGYPITDLVTETLEDGKPYQVQWFERARFELHPENSPPYNILLGQFGRQIYGSQAR